MKLTDEQIAKLNRFKPGRAVAHALSELLNRDAYLLEIDANERSIAYRFAFYLQVRLPNWTVDCEYNRDGVEPKRLGSFDIHPDNEDDEAKTVFPDVIVHQRGTSENYLVIEFKKSTSNVDRDIDRRKLEGYKRQLRYPFALFIEVGTKGQANVTQLEWI